MFLKQSKKYLVLTNQKELKRKREKRAEDTAKYVLSKNMEI